MVFYVSNCSYMEFPKMNFLHVKKITAIPIFHSICVSRSRLKHFPTNGRVSCRGVRGSDWAGKGQYFYPIRH